MTATLIGLTNWTGARDDEGHRTYEAEWKVLVSDANDGPNTVLNCPGIPAVGSAWFIGNDSDTWAFCTPGLRASTMLSNEPGTFWKLQQKFSTNPSSRCQSSTIENPLDMPPRINGGFNKYQEEAVTDRHGIVIRNFCHERIRGAPVTFDKGRPNVSIEFNTLFLPIGSIADMIDKVNDRSMWGLDARMIKLSNATWQRLVYGTCSYYYSVAFEFDINRDTFDRKVKAEARRCLTGWAPGTLNRLNGEPTKPNPDMIDAETGKAIYLVSRYFEAYTDKKGNNMTCFTDEKGRPLDETTEPPEIDVEYYEEANLLETGVPSSF